MRLLSYAIFVTMMLLVGGGMHFYIWTRLGRDPGWPSPWPKVTLGVAMALVVAVPLAVATHRALPRAVARILSLPAYVWMGVVFLLFVLVAASDLLRAARAGLEFVMNAAAGKEPAAPDPERRRLMARATAGAITTVAATASVTAVRGGLADVEVKEVEVPLPRLPKTLEGLTIVQLTDVHVGPTIGRKDIEALVEKCNAARPDVVVITGDLVDGSVAQLGEHTAPLSKIEARWGKYFVTGNHEYYSGVTPWLKELDRLGYRALRNERVEIGDAGATIDLAGVDDANAHRFGNGHGPDVARAVAGRDPDRELVLLAHQPKTIADTAGHGVGLQISGHTHGGQIWPFGGLVRLAQPYVSGLYRHDEKTQIYVSHGAGYWGPPMRLLAPSEISKLVLVSA